MAAAETAYSDDISGVRPPAEADAAASLLLALTALYVQRSNHTAEEQQQYTELALHLIGKVGPRARAAVAGRLQCHTDAPAAIVERLGDTPPRAGEGITPEPSAAVSATGSPATPTPEFGEAFFAASPAERRKLLSRISRAGVSGVAPENGSRFHVRIDIAAWHGRTGAFARDFGQLIDAPASLCERILDDPSGEPMVIAARATGMPVALLQRILLLVSPATSHSVTRVYELTELYHDLDVRAARDLLAAWRDGANRDGPSQAPSAPVTNLSARFRALNARIESQSGFRSF